MLLERKGPFLKFLGRTLNEVIRCYWVCVFVCLFPYSSETFNPNELKFWGKISLWGANDFRQKINSGLSNCSPENQKKTLAIILHVIHSNTTENHYNFAAAQPLVSNKMLYLWPIIWKIEFCYLYKQYLIFTILT